MGPFGSNIKAENFTFSGVPVIRGTNLNNYKYVGGEFVYLTEEKANQLIGSNCESGDLVFTHRGTIGQVGLIPDGEYSRYVVSQSGMKLTPDESKITSDFLFYFFISKYGQYQLLKYESQVGVPSISNPLTSLKAIEVPVPPLIEQKAITAVLSSLDDKIDLLHRQNKTLENLAQTLFRHWFIDGATDDWEEKPLQDVVDIAIGRTPPRKEFHWFSKDPSNTKWVSIKDLGNEGLFIFDTSEYLTAEAIQKFRVPVIPTDTVVLSFKMTLGRVGITTEEITSNEAIAHFKFKDATPFCKEYLYFFLKLFKYQQLGSTSSIVTSINTRMIKAMEIPIPDADTMNKFADVTTEFFEKIKKNQAQIQTLEKLRDTLLPKLMSGAVRVRQPELTNLKDLSILQ